MAARDALLSWITAVPAAGRPPGSVSPLSPPGSETKLVLFVLGACDSGRGESFGTKARKWRKGETKPEGRGQESPSTVLSLVSAGGGETRGGGERRGRAPFLMMHHDPARAAAPRAG